MVEETLANLFLDWKSLVLVFFILGVGYVGLFYVCALRKNDIFHDIPVFDKLIISSLLGFVSFSAVLSISGVKIVNEIDIFNLISEQGVGLFIVTIVICLAISFMISIVDYSIRWNWRK